MVVETVLVPEQLLDGADVAACFEEVRRKGMPERVTGRSLGQTGAGDGVLDGSLDERLVDVMSALFAGLVVGPAVLLREDPLPTPVGGSVQALPGGGGSYRPASFSHVLNRLPQFLHSLRRINSPPNARRV